ncbi:thiol reductant ABC exporter subunit CydD [Arsenicicoccus piscis]|uniref:Thiol reductant ABC exporter subunit CydD n=1 Tax=Arsenicicoccus piscis TaxID=673954 RepID=A0ABQ6HS37_9MICO|nr:thiol reductant ABC exporter subunit CydD [Arsenicicoccus piscis]MCH8626555.1 thiol reductant ABC exporter subunit CydD [Arsenicicoccus piscis]GMA21201.1 hypothetical protein GCM10025862_32220 [Arsenicicoccus piscis]
MKPFDPAVLRLLPAARRPLAVLVLLGVAAGVAALAQAFALATAVTVVVDGSGLGGSGLARSGVGTAVLVLAAVLAVRALLAGATELAASWASRTVSAGLRRTLVAHLARPERGDALAPGTAVALVTQGASATEPYVARYLPALVSGTVLPVLAIATMLVIDWRSGILVLLTVPLLPLFAALIGSATAQASARRWATLAQLAGHFLDVMRGLPTLVSYGRAERQATVIAETSERHRRATMSTLRLAFLSSAALELLATISVALVAVSVGIRLTWGDLDLHTGLVAILLAPEAYWPIRRVGQEFHAAADGAAALSQAVEVLDGSAAGLPAGTSGRSRVPVGSRGADASRDAHASLDEGTIRLVDVDYHYPGSESLVLQSLSFDLGPGLTVITGPSGSGKSTLLDVLCGLRPPTRGEVTGLAAGRGPHLVSQRPFLVPGTIRDNLTLGLASHQRPRDDGLWQALTRVGLAETVAGLPGGLSATIGDDGVGLSAGQRARLALARALLHDPAVLVLDEPTAHLDAAGTAHVEDLLVSVATERPVVVVTHRPSFAARADRQVTR